jgi:hypothetical protein
MSRHQKDAEPNVAKSPNKRRVNPILNECIYNATPTNKKNAPNATKIGHGLGSTI